MLIPRPEAELTSGKGRPMARTQEPIAVLGIGVMGHVNPGFRLKAVQGSSTAPARVAARR